MSDMVWRPSPEERAAAERKAAADAEVARLRAEVERLQRHADGQAEVLKAVAARAEAAEAEAGRLGRCLQRWLFCPWCGKPLPLNARCLCSGWTLAALSGEGENRG